MCPSAVSLINDKPVQSIAEVIAKGDNVQSPFTTHLFFSFSALPLICWYFYLASLKALLTAVWWLIGQDESRKATTKSVSPLYNQVPPTAYTFGSIKFIWLDYKIMGTFLKNKFIALEHTTMAIKYLS